MTNLAIECSGTAGSVALFDGDVRIAYADLDSKVGSVRSLAGAIDTVVRSAGRPKFVSVTNGPGSFTGLRVGLTTAKMLAMAWKIPVVPVDTLQAIALRARLAKEQNQASAESPDAIFIAVLNAFRGQVFASALQFDQIGRLSVLARSTVLDAELWRQDPAASLGVSGSPFSDCPKFVSGPGLSSYAVSCPNVCVVDAELWQPTATEVAALGNRVFAASGGTTAALLQPNYIRASAAEEKSPLTKR